MPSRTDPQPMITFDPTLSALVHEALNDVEVEWPPITTEEWRSKAEWVDDSQTVIRWGEMLLDRWWPAHVEDIHPDKPDASTAE